MEDFTICFNEEKEQLLQITRNVSFELVLVALKEKRILKEAQHPSHRRNTQRIYVIEINHYAYVVPYVINQEKKEIFLKTIYPSRYYTKLLLSKKGAI